MKQGEQKKQRHNGQQHKTNHFVQMGDGRNAIHGHQSKNIEIHQRGEEIHVVLKNKRRKKENDGKENDGKVEYWNMALVKYLSVLK